MRVAGEALHFAQFFIQRLLAFALDAEVDGGGDVEPAEGDVFLFQDQLEVTADGIHGVGFLGFATPFRPDFDGFQLGGGGLLFRDDPGGNHPVESGATFAGGSFHRAEGVVGIRATDDAGEQGGLGKRELGRVFFKIDPRGLTDAFDLAAPVDLVDVGFQDLVFAQSRFEAECDGDFQAFPVELARGVAAFFAAFELEDIGNKLLGDGGCAFLFPLEVFQDRAADADEIDGAVAVKPLVLPGENGLAEVF